MRTLVVLVVLVLASHAVAQDAAVAAPSVPPVMIAVLPSGHVPDDVTLAVQTALVDAVRPLAGGRPVLALAQPELRDRLAACADAACQGAFLGETGAIGAIVARLSRRTTRGETAMTLDMIDPISGTARVPQQSTSVVDAAAVPAAITPLIEALRGAMFSPPPPPPTLLVTVNVDGATVTVDDEPRGQSPIASLRLTPGHHVVMVTRDGYAGTRRELDLAEGQQERIDVNLAPLEGVTIAADTSQPSYAGGSVATPWYEEWWVWAIVGGGALVVAGVIIGVVVGTQPTAQPDPTGIPLPGLRF